VWRRGVFWCEPIFDVTIVGTHYDVTMRHKINIKYQYFNTDFFVQMLANTVPIASLEQSDSVFDVR